MPVTLKLPPMPRQEVPLIDPKTGKMDQHWYRFFFELMRVLEEMRTEIP